MLPFVGPSYDVFGGRASASRSVNLYLSAMEAPAKAGFVLNSVPGLIQRASSGAEVRGALACGERCLFVAGSSLYEVSSDWALTVRGTLATDTGTVGMVWGLTQLLIVDGLNGYVLNLNTNVFEQITDEDFPGSYTAGYLNGFYTLIGPDSQQAYVTALDDATNIDSLDAVSSLSSPDRTVGQVTIFGEWWMLGSESTEVWSAVPSADFPFARNNGATSAIGCIAPHSVRIIDNGFMMLGRDRNGSGMVYRANGLQLTRVSNQGVEQALQQSTDLSSAVAYVYQKDGLTFWCVNAPGLDATYCYEVSTGTWHERCDLDDDGQLTAGRVTHACFVFGVTLGFDADGYVYELDADTYTNAGDPLVRLRVSPNDVTPSRDRVFYSEFIADVTAGEVAQGAEYCAELSYSNDGGKTWGDWLLRSTGRVGEYKPRLQWTRLGSARDRVWRLRYSGNTAFTIVAGQAR